MKKYEKIYSVELFFNAMYGIENNLKAYGDYHITITKLNDNLFELRLYKNSYQKFVVVNTIDCLYSLLDGYYKAIYDNN